MSELLHPFTALETFNGQRQKLGLDEELLVAAIESPRSDSLDHGATPLDKLLTEREQESVRQQLQRLTNTFSDEIPIKIGSYIRDTFERRFEARRDANDENFSTRLVDGYDNVLRIELFDMVERARLGDASPAELIIVRNILGIRSVEFACVTHPYGEPAEMQKLAAMRGGVRQDVLRMGGTLIDEPKSKYRIKELVGTEDDGLMIDDAPSGMLMTRKRVIGHLPDGSIVKERSSFVLRLDKESQVYAILGAEAVAELTAMASLSADEQEKVLTKYEDVISAFLVINQFTDAIPVSTTMYAHNEVTAQLIESGQLRILETIDSEAPDYEPTEEELRVQDEITKKRMMVLAREEANRQSEAVAQDWRASSSE